MAWFRKLNCARSTSKRPHAASRSEQTDDVLPSGSLKEDQVGRPQTSPRDSIPAALQIEARPSTSDSITKEGSKGYDSFHRWSHSQETEHLVGGGPPGDGPPGDGPPRQPSTRKTLPPVPEDSIEPDMTEALPFTNMAEALQFAEKSAEMQKKSETDIKILRNAILDMKRRNTELRAEVVEKSQNDAYHKDRLEMAQDNHRQALDIVSKSLPVTRIERYMQEVGVNGSKEVLEPSGEEDLAVTNTQGRETGPVRVTDKISLCDYDLDEKTFSNYSEIFSPVFEKLRLQCTKVILEDPWIHTTSQVKDFCDFAIAVAKQAFGEISGCKVTRTLVLRTTYIDEPPPKPYNHWTEMRNKIRPKYLTYDKTEGQILDPKKLLPRIEQILKGEVKLEEEGKVEKSYLPELYRTYRLNKLGKELVSRFGVRLDWTPPEDVFHDRKVTFFNVVPKYLVILGRGLDIFDDDATGLYKPCKRGYMYFFSFKA